MVTTGGWLGRAALVAALAGLLAACAETPVVATFTDDHGRVCTAIVVRQTDGGRSAGGIDCEYPQPGRPAGDGGERNLSDETGG